MSCENTVAANTNATSLAVTKDASPFDANTEWLYMEPNEITAYAATLEKTARDPISNDRQRRKGTITSLTAAPAFSADLTMDMIGYFMPGFMFSIWKGLQPESYEVTSAAATGSTYNVATGGAVLAAGTLAYASGFINPENNGLKTVASSTSTTVVVNETLVDEASSDMTKLYAVGVRGATADLQIDAAGDLISTVLDFTTLGLNVGQYIRVGGALAANQFDTAVNNSFARISAISANKLELQAQDQPFTLDAGVGKDIDVYFSAWVRNVPVGDIDFNKQWYHMEATYDTTPTLYEYADCCINNTLALNNALQDKATLDLGFVGKDVRAPTDTPELGDRTNQTRTEAFNTTADIVRVRIADDQDTGLTTFFKDSNISINNNVSSEYVLGQLAAEFINFGNIEVDLDTSVVFTGPEILAAIRNNTTLSLELAYQNDEGGFIVHLPSGTFGDGSKNFARNEKVKLATPFEAFKDDALEYTMSCSLFWYLP